MNKKSSSFFRVDEQVFFTMGAVCILSLIVMAFRIGTHTPCSPVQIAVNSTALIQGNVIRFKAETQLGKTFSWNFGDGTLKDDAIAITNHEYKKAGHYTVTVLVNGECSDMQDIVIGEAPVIVNTNLQPLIMCSANDTAYIGEPVTFTDVSTASTKWEWRFGEKSSVDATTRDASYTFTIPGRKTVLLKVNNRNDLITSHTLFVIDKQAEKIKLEKLKAESQRRNIAPQILIPQKPNTDPLKPQEEIKKEEVKVKPKAPSVTNEQLTAMLRQVAEGNKRAEDFSEYLGGQLGISVSLNKNIMPFSKMCEELKNMKKIKSISVFSTVDKETNQVLSMNITVEKKKVLGIF